MKFSTMVPEDAAGVESLLTSAHGRYEFPSLSSRSIYATMLRDEAGNMMGAATAVLVPEVTIVLDPDLHPAVKLSAIRQMHELLPRIKQAGYDTCIAFMPPEIEIPYSRRLRTLGWVKQWPCYALKF